MDCPFSENARIKYKDLQASLRAFLKEVDIKDGLATISLALSLSENHISSDELTARMIRAQAHPPILQFPGFEIHKEPPTPGELQRLSFIDKLPNEILFDILEICWKCYEIEQDQIHAHKTLELVCHRWLGITRSSPVLFSRTSIHRNSRIILHSNNAPLTIIGPLYNNLFMELIKPSYQRWRSLESNCRYGNDNTAQYFNIPAPILKSFKVKLSSENAVHLFAGQAPQLQYLEIPSMVIRWDLNILRGLRTLHIMAWDGFEVPSNTKMRQVLQACPDLQELHLIGRQGLSFPGSGPAPLDDVTTRIPLPHLRQLRLFHLPLNTLRCLLASVNAPPFDEVWVEITTPSESALLQVFDGLPHDNALINAIRPSSKTHLLLGGYDAVWIQLRSRLPESDIYEPRLRIRGGGGCSTLNPLLLFSTLFSRWASTIETLQIWELPSTLCFSPNYTQVAHRFLCSLVNVNKLLIKHQEPHRYFLFDTLGTPISHGSVSNQIWPCPNLTTLALHGSPWFNVQELLSCLKTRYGVGNRGTQREGPGVPLPAVLEELSIKGNCYYLDDNAHVALEEIAALIGDGVFYCNNP